MQETRFQFWAEAVEKMWKKEIRSSTRKDIRLEFNLSGQHSRPTTHNIPPFCDTESCPQSIQNLSKST
jgi:hypothetical protein